MALLHSYSCQDRWRTRGILQITNPAWEFTPYTPKSSESLVRYSRRKRYLIKAGFVFCSSYRFNATSSDVTWKHWGIKLGARRCLNYIALRILKAEVYSHEVLKTVSHERNRARALKDVWPTLFGC